VLARLQQIITITLLSVAIAWAGWALSQGRWILALIGVAVLAGGHALFLAIECGWMSWSNRRDTVPPGKAREVLAAWLGEALCAPRIFCWQQPFRAHAWPDRTSGRPGQRGVVLVHGFVCNRGLWNRWYPRLAEAGIPFVGVNLEPVFGEIDRCAGPVDAAIDALQTRTGLAPVVVAHSMGGLAVRAWLRSQGGAAAMQRVHRVVTLGSPHSGTLLAGLGLSANAQQMRRNSGWLRALAATESPSVLERFTCVYSNCDNIVFPASSALLPHAASLQVHRCAHVHLVDHPAVYALVRDCLQASPPPAEEAAPGVPAAA
jgi:pimeloyl-ACP methyl ester carboxylesterase